METGFRGAFVISWQQTDVDGQKATTPEELSIGAAWRWSGKPVRVDGPGELLSLGAAEGTAELHKRAARRVRQLVGAALGPSAVASSGRDRAQPEQPLLDAGFIVTDGRVTYSISLIEVGGGAPPLLMMLDELPPRDTDLWIVHRTIDHHITHFDNVTPGGVICFTPGTRLATPEGPKLIEDLAEGDLVSTRDGGNQDVRWIGKRRMSGARLYAMPHLRPVRIRAGAMGEDEPESDLLVSPDHRVLLRGPQAEALFNTPEVLVAAKDLVNDHSVLVDHSIREVTYIHLALDQHHVVWANGVETESFHPASAALEAVAEDERARLLAQFPQVAENPYSYGDYARRSLSAPEAALLRHAGGIGH